MPDKEKPERLYNKSSVGADNLSCNKRCFIGSKKQNNIGYFLRCAHTPERCLLTKFPNIRRRKIMIHVSIYNAGSNTVV